MSSPNHGPNYQLIMPASLTDEVLSLQTDVSGFTSITFYVLATGTVSSGVLTIEEAPTENFAGTWSSITTVNFGSVSVADGAILPIHLSPDTGYRWVRARISTVIGGTGTITVSLAVQ